MRSPTFAVDRRSARPCGAVPTRTISINPKPVTVSRRSVRLRLDAAAIKGDSAVSPPARGTLYLFARERNPSKKRSRQEGRPERLRTSSTGSASDKNAASGLAPIAARSLNPRARQRCPTDSGECHSRRKWTDSKVKSVVTRTSFPAGGPRMAQSSPIPAVTNGDERVEISRRAWERLGILAA